MTDIGTALTGSIARDGQSPATANIPMGNNKLTGLATPTTRTDATSLGSIVDGVGVYGATVGGTGNAITVTLAPVLTAYAAGQKFSFIAGAANTGAVTVNLNSVGAKAITKVGTTALVANDILSGSLVEMEYDGTRFQLLSPIGTDPTGTYLPLAGGTLTGDLNMSAKSVNGAVHTEAAHATTSDIWSGGNTCLLSGGVVTFTDVADAPQAGAIRYVVANAAHVITDNAALEMDGNANYTCAANDVLMFTAKTTSTFRVNVLSHGDTTGDYVPSAVAITGGTINGTTIGASTPAAGDFTTLDATGVATATTFEPDGDTSASDNAAIGYTAAEGLILTGQGSSGDVTIKNDADAKVMEVLTGTTTAAFSGQVTGTGFTGTLDGVLGGGTPAAATVTTMDASGVATATTFEPDGDTSASDNAAIGYTAAEGLILTGQGSTTDVTIKNDADAKVMGVLTGTTTAAFEGEVTATGFTGTLDGVLGGGTPAAATTTTLNATGVATMRSEIDESSAYTGQLVIDSVTKSAGHLARILFEHDDHGSASIASDYESAGNGNLIFSTRGGGNPTERMRIAGNGSTTFSGGVSATTLNTSGAVVFNDAGADVDFRVEGDTNTNLLVVDASTNKVGIGSAPTDGTLHVQTATAGSVSASANADELVVENSGTGGISILTPDASTGLLYFGSPSDSIGAFLDYNYNASKFKIGTANAGHTHVLLSDNSIVNLTLSGGSGSEVAAFAGQVTGTGFTGTLDGVLGGGTPAAATTTTLNTSGAVVFNDAGAAVDFRVEGDTKPFLLFASGTEDKIGINTSGVIAQLTVDSGDIAISSTQASDNGDLGEFQFWNRTNAGSGVGQSFVNDVAAIQGKMEGTGNNSGGSLHFYTKTDGGDKVERMSIDGAGTVVLSAPLPIASGGMGIGTGQRVVQVVTGTTSTQVINNTSTLADTGLAATITPKFSDSTILIQTSIQGVHKSDANAGNRVDLQLSAGGTGIDTSGANLYTASTLYMRGSFSHQFTHATGATDAVEYKWQFMNPANTAGVRVQQDSNSGRSQITLIEVAS